MTQYVFYDRFRVEIRGRATVTDYLRKTFERFAVPDDGDEPDMVVSVANDQPAPDEVLGDADRYFGVEGNRFVIKEGNAFMTVDTDWSHIRTSPENIHHHIAFLLEFEVRTRLAEEGRALVHAAGAVTQGEAMLFPAWRSAGKTNTMLTLVMDGAGYLSDDRVWVDGDGTVYEYPIPINILARNFDMFGVSPDLTRSQRLRQAVSEFVFDRVDMQRSLLDKATYFVTDQLLSLEPRYRLFTIQELVPAAEPVSEAALDRLIFLRTTPDAPEHGVSVAPIDEGDGLTGLRTISYWEWNRRLQDYFGAFDMLFPGSDRRSELDALLEAEERIFEDLVEEVDLYRATVPRETDWTGTGIAAQIREKLPSQSGVSDAPSSDTT